MLVLPIIFILLLGINDYSGKTKEKELKERIANMEKENEDGKCE